LGSSGERLDAIALDHLEGTIRHVAEELAGWRARALKSEAEARHGPAAAAPAPTAPGLTLARPDPELRTRMAEMEAENRALRQRVEATRARLHDLLTRLSFLEEQGRETAGGATGTGGAAR
jgi:hypothetical protein